jgi:hypothetical protein
MQSVQTMVSQVIYYQNYYKLFADLARKNEIWFAVCSDGTLDYLENTRTGNDYQVIESVKFGTKEAYECLLRIIWTKS